MTQEYEQLKLEGNQHFKEERFQQAVDCYTEALKLQPQCHLLYSNRSAAHNRLGNYEEALADADCCLSISPQFARGHLRKATVLNELGKYREAMKSAENGYKLRGSDRICKDCVSLWLKASSLVFAADVAKMEDVPQGVSPVSSKSVEILSRIQSEHSKPSGVSREFMEFCLVEVVAELQCVLELFGHSIGLTASAWVTALTQALKADPRTHTPTASALQSLSVKRDQYMSHLHSEVDPILYPVLRPIFALAILSILTYVSSLNQVISSRDMIQCLLRSCLPFFAKSILSGKQYIRLHIHTLQQLLNSYCMESGHGNYKERREKEREEVKKLSKTLSDLMEEYPTTACDYTDVKRSTTEILENSSLLLSPDISQPTKRLTRDDVGLIKKHIAEETQQLQSMTEPLNFRHMDSLVLATGGLVHLGEVQLALDALKLSESLYFKVITTLFENRLLSLDAQPLFHPQAMMHANSLFLKDIDNSFIANIFLRWKCISSELFAILVRLGVGECLMSTFQRIEHFKADNTSHDDTLADIADHHKKEVEKVLCEWGPRVVQAISNQSVGEIQKQLGSEQVLLEYCMAPLYDTACHPVPIPPKCLAVSGVVVVLQSEGAPLVKKLDFDKIQILAVRMHDTAMKAVAAKRSGKPWQQLQLTADATANSLLEALLPTEVQSLLDSKNIKRVFFCPDLVLAKVPVEILPFGDGTRFGEKYAIAYLSSAKELLRDSVVESLFPNSKKASPSHPDCVFFANPNFDLEQVKHESTGGFSPWSQLSSALASLFSKPPGDCSTKVSALPESEAEAKEIEYLLTNTHSGNLRTKLIVGSNATLHHALSVQSPRILHFATHGFSSPDFHYQYKNFWSDTRSGILLAGANTYHCGNFEVIAREAGTGELSALAACGMILQGTALVYLSTCRSTYGFIGRGEALSSLAQGFRSAGAQTVIATLWPVADEISRKLAVYFYSFACKPCMHPSVALQEAKKKIQEEGHDYWYDWAAFMCIGTDLPIFV